MCMRLKPWICFTQLRYVFAAEGSQTTAKAWSREQRSEKLGLQHLIALVSEGSLDGHNQAQAAVAPQQLVDLGPQPAKVASTASRASVPGAAATVRVRFRISYVEPA